MGTDFFANNVNLTVYGTYKCCFADVYDISADFRLCIGYKMLVDGIFF